MLPRNVEKVSNVEQVMLSRRTGFRKRPNERDCPPNESPT